jgi:hypothetical protein
MKKSKTLIELFSFPGFTAKNKLEGKFGEPKIRIIDLKRKKKYLSALFANLNHELFMIEKLARYVTVMQKVIKFIIVMRDGEYSARSVAG